MNKVIILYKLKKFIGTTSWKLFLWSIGRTQNEYWEEIYQQEKRFKEKQKLIMFEFPILYKSGI
jgi:hypothetical protein